MSKKREHTLNDITEDTLDKIIEGYVHITAIYMLRIFESAIARPLTKKETIYIEDLCDEICNQETTLVNSPADYQSNNADMSVAASASRQVEKKISEWIKKDGFKIC